MATFKTYRFKPLKALTFWACLLIVVRLVALAAYAYCDASQALNGTRVDFDTGLPGGDPFSWFAFGAALLYFVTYLVSGFVSLFWIWGAARNALALKPGLPITPGRAVGWFFIPFANLYKPYQYMRYIWQASGGFIEKGGEPRQVQGWWIFTIFGNILAGIASRLGNAVDGATWDLGLEAAAFGLLFVGTVLFFNVVRAIHRLQLTSDTRVAETF